MTVFFKLLMTVLGLVLMAVGVVITPLPGPFGVPVILLGLIILLRSSMWVKRLFMRLVKRHPKLLKPLRAMLRPGAKVVAMLWLQALRLERRVLPKNRRMLYRFRHDLKMILRNRRPRPKPDNSQVHRPRKVLSY
ncbi:MAG: PGPGW domain-containing protein [Asticcacaulis sp.]|uniref:PGPGW domain-containing protein n=1 Tax=Asticcacaulis sp. TaxID=1872648 RepID=UPI0039E24EFB